MLVDTDRLVRLCQDYQTIADELDPAEFDPDIERQLIAPISDELNRKFGNFIYHASSLVLVGGIESRGDMRGLAVTNPPNFVGVNPRVESIAYPQSSLGRIGLTPSLVFETYELELVSDIPCGISQLFPYVALPLIEPHSVEAIALQT